jgi:hypothetical protein
MYLLFMIHVGGNVDDDDEYFHVFHYEQFYLRELELVDYVLHFN